jgi:predicted nucleotidyltransferase
MAARILREAGATGVYVFGSAGDEREMLPGREPRDIDLAVEGLPPEAFVRTVGRLLAELRFPVDLVDLDRPTPLAQRLRERGRLRRVA